jgi:hypothetical protein
MDINLKGSHMSVVKGKHLLLSVCLRIAIRPVGNNNF